jgi:cell division protein FtsA
VTNVSLYAGGMLLGLTALPFGSSDITDAIASAFGIRRFQAQRLKSRYGSAIASPSDYKDMIPVNGPNEAGDEAAAAPAARGADDKNRVPRAELISIITEQLSRLTDEIGRALKGMGFSGAKGGQVVVTGGGAELAGIAEFLQSALGRPVRIGKPPALRGLGEANASPSFVTLTGLCLYAADDPVDIRAVGPKPIKSVRYSGLGIATRVWRAAREYF